jgi:hypothetical protein
VRPNTPKHAESRLESEDKNEFLGLAFIRTRKQISQSPGIGGGVGRWAPVLFRKARKPSLVNLNMQSKDNLRKRRELTFGSKSVFVGNVCHFNELAIGRRVRVSPLFDLSEKRQAISLKLHKFLINRNRGRRGVFIILQMLKYH